MDDCTQLSKPDTPSEKARRVSAPTGQLSIYGLGFVEMFVTTYQLLASTGAEVVNEIEFADQPDCNLVELADVDAAFEMKSVYSQQRLHAIRLTTSRYRTPSGLHVGSTMGDVVDALGPQLEISPHDLVDGGFYLDFVHLDPTESNVGIRFEVIEDQVVSISAGFRDVTRQEGPCT